MKPKVINLISISFFLILNTQYFWEDKIGVLEMIINLLLLVTFFLLVLLLLYLILNSFFKNLKPYKSNISIFILALVLLSSFIKPHGIIDFENIISPTIFIAEREGTANCKTYLYLKKDNTFTRKAVCFGVEKYFGKYTIEKDTIKFFFENNVPKEYQTPYAIVTLSKDKTYGKLDYFREGDKKNSIPMFISKNELIK